MDFKITLAHLINLALSKTGYGFPAVTDTKFCINIIDMRFNSAHFHEVEGGNFFVAFSCGN